MKRFTAILEKLVFSVNKMFSIYFITYVILVIWGLRDG